jgi:hypothetical protein
MNEAEQAMKAKNDISRAVRADELLANPLYKEAITAIEVSLFESFKDSKLTNEQERHELWQRMQLLKQFQAKFEHIVREGEKARQTLTMLEKAKQLIRI